jgi:hypothetical protein
MATAERPAAALPRNGAAILSLATLALLAATATWSASIAQAAPPDETCIPGQTFAAGGFDVCAPPAIGTGGGGIAIGGLLPIILALVVGAGLALAVAFLVLRRRAGGPLDPVDAGEWWTCANCGRQNVVGSPRCYACGTWQGGSRPDRPAPGRQ